MGDRDIWVIQSEPTQSYFSIIETSQCAREILTELQDQTILVYQQRLDFPLQDPTCTLLSGTPNSQVEVHLGGLLHDCEAFGLGSV